MKKEHKRSLGVFAAGSLGGLAAQLVVIAGVYTAADTLGFQLDRPAWHSEALVLVNAFKELGEDIDGRELRRLRDEADDIELAMKRDEIAGRPVDQVKALQLRQKRRQIDDLEKDMAK